MLESNHARCLAIVLFLAACSKSAPPAAAPPPPEVRIVVVSSQPIANMIELPGRLQAIRTSEVRARVDGIVERRLYTEGTDVARRPAAVRDRPARAARAGSTRPQAALVARRGDRGQRRSRTSTRYKGLVAQQALSQQEYDAAVARLRTAQADVAQSRARSSPPRGSTSSYTTVTAPISGRAGRAEVTEGALVSGAQAHAADAHRAARSDLRELLAVELRPCSTCAGSSGPAPSTVPDRRALPVHLVLEDGSRTACRGRLDFVDLSIDEPTGHRGAARRASPTRSARCCPASSSACASRRACGRTGCCLPQRAVTRHAAGRARVMVVGAKDVVEARPVKLGAARGRLVGDPERAQAR